MEGQGFKEGPAKRFELRMGFGLLHLFLLVPLLLAQSGTVVVLYNYQLQTQVLVVLIMPHPPSLLLPPHPSPFLLLLLRFSPHLSHFLLLLLVLILQLPLQ